MTSLGRTKSHPNLLLLTCLFLITSQSISAQSSGKKRVHAYSFLVSLLLLDNDHALLSHHLSYFIGLISVASIPVPGTWSPYTSPCSSLNWFVFFFPLISFFSFLFSSCENCSTAWESHTAWKIRENLVADAGRDDGYSKGWGSQSL